jgi:hypothetical protein
VLHPLSYEGVPEAQPQGFPDNCCSEVLPRLHGTAVLKSRTRRRTDVPLWARPVCPPGELLGENLRHGSVD